MKRIQFFLLLAISLIYSFGFAQVRMDIELKSEITFNSNELDFKSNTYNSYLRNGFSRGLGFDIWLPKDYAISFGYSLSRSMTNSQFKYPEWFRSSQTSWASGVLRDDIFYLGVKKSFLLGNTTRVMPFAGLYLNPYSFDNKDREYTATVSQGDVIFYENLHYYSRYNQLDNRNSIGAIGSKLGLTIEQDLGNLGRLSLNVSYSFDFAKDLTRMDYQQMYIEKYTNNGQFLQNSYYATTLDHRILGRNLFQIELGYKMPCSIFFGRKKKTTSSIGASESALYRE